MLLESAEDTALDILDASDELGLFLAVAKRSVESAQLKKIRLIMMPLRQVLSRSRNIALSSSCLSTWHYLLYKLGDLINHLSILEAVFVPVLKIIFSTGLDNANKPLWSFCINLFDDFISVKFRHMASPGEYLCVPLNQNLLSQSCMHLKALLDVQHIKWLSWDVTSFDFQLEILGSIVNPELLQNMTHEMMVIVMDSATQIFRLLIQGVRVDCKVKFTYNIQICITKACQFVKKVFLDLVGKQNSDSCAVLVQFSLQFMKVTAEELDHSLLASGKYEICLDIEHIKEMQYAECSPKISYPEIRPLSYMEMVSPAVYMTAVSLSMVAQFTGELSHGHADQLALVFCSSDFSENFHAVVVLFVYADLEHLLELNLSKNHLNGSVPAKFGNLRSIQVINISNNNLSGYFLEELGQLQNLDSLILNNNNLVGEIPAQLANCFSSNTLKLSYNNFSGYVPLIKNFSKFPMESFLGNPRLYVYCQDFSCGHFHGSRVNITRTAIACIILGFIILLCVMLLAIYRTNQPQPLDKGSYKPVQAPPKLVILQMVMAIHTYEDIRRLIENLSEKYIIGYGASSTVYKCVLKSGKAIAVKRLYSQYNHSFREFETELETIGSIRHRNLVSLHGFSLFPHGNRRFYDNMENGSLWDLLHGPLKKVKLDWNTRLKIAAVLETRALPR